MAISVTRQLESYEKRCSELKENRDSLFWNQIWLILCSVSILWGDKQKVPIQPRSEPVQSISPGSNTVRSRSLWRFLCTQERCYYRAWVTPLGRTMVTGPQPRSQTQANQQSYDMVTVSRNIYSYGRKSHKSRQVKPMAWMKWWGGHSKGKSLLFSGDTLSICIAES